MLTTLEGLPALLIFGPILFPIAKMLGIDPVPYGIVIGPKALPYLGKNRCMLAEGQ